MNDALTIIRKVKDAHLLSFEGIQVRSDALEILRATEGRTVTCPELAKGRGRSAGGTAKVVKHYVLAGLMEAVQLRATRAPALGAQFGYRMTDKGARLVRAADNLEAQMAAHDEAAEGWPPRVDANKVVSAALRTQPSSIFDMARLVMADDPPPVVAEPRRMPANSVFALAA